MIIIAYFFIFVYFVFKKVVDLYTLNVYIMIMEDIIYETGISSYIYTIK